MNLAAAAAPMNKVFAAWTGNTTGVANVSSPNTTLVMPNNAVTLTATYDIRPGAYTLTVNNGTGSGSYDPGTSVLVSAREPLPGEAFAWTGDRQILANWLMPTTSALMPFQDVAITATYGHDGASTLTVNGGSGSGSYPVGHTVNVVANAPPAGQVFAGWTGDTVILADQDPSRAATTAMIPSIDVAITATYVPGSTGTARAVLQRQQ